MGRKIKLIMQLVAAFIVAALAYNIFYEPRQDTVRAAVQQAKPKAVAAVTGRAGTDVTATAQGVQGKLKITLLDVGHGDAILLQDGRTNVMVDVGKFQKDKSGRGGKDALIASLAKAGVNADRDRINTVIITHHHADHLGNIKWFAGRYRVSNIYDSAFPNTANQISVWLNGELRAGHYHNRVLRAGARIDLGKDYYLEVLSPGDFLTAQDLQSFNNSSVVMKLHYGQFSMLLTGDAEAPVEERLAQRLGAGLRADVLKVGHHGSKTSSYYPFISQVRPKYALISCGDFAIYHHPNKNVVGRLQHLGAKVLTTHEHGNLVVTTDGKSFDVNTER
jgi:competence protein ComEC